MNSKNLIVISLIIGSFWLLGFYRFYEKPPDSFHLGAQTDRSAIVLNYANGSTTFFYPKVMETRISEGIVGCEFPGLYYVIGNVFKATGFRYDIYRLTIWFFYLLALWSIFKIAQLHLTQTNSLLVTGIVGFSPILSFYGLNFLPDVPALGLSMFGWWLILKNRKNKFSLVLGILFMALAGLLKASYAMHLAVVFTVFVLDKRKIKWTVLVTSLIGFAAIAAWYEWATYLNETYQNPHFLLSPNPAKSFPDFLDLMGSNWDNWASELYPLPTLLFSLFGIYACYFLRKQKKKIFHVTTRIGAFWILFYLLFQTQFKYHDYYLIAVYPLLFFLILHAFIYIEQHLYRLRFIKQMVIYLFLFTILIQNFLHAKEQLNERHKIGSYYYQPPMPGTIEKYIGMDSFLDMHLKQKDRIISIYDNTPNSTLFFSRRKGCRIAEDFSDDLVAEIVNDTQYQYLLINNISGFKKTLENIDYTLKDSIASYRGITLYNR